MAEVKDVATRSLTQLVPVASLKPAPWNPRVLKDARFKTLCESIVSDPDFLWQRPILATADGTVFAGNMRLRAVESLGWTEVPAIIEDIPVQLAKERALRDNNAWGEWEDDGLAAMLAELQASGSNLDLLGFDAKELDRLLASVGGGTVGEDTADLTPPVEPISRVGDLWILGEHRLLCGDSTKAEDVERLMDGERARSVLTDPPYGIDQPGVPMDSPESLQSNVDGCVRLLPCDDAVVVAFQSTRTFPVWLDSIREAGHEFQRMLWLYKAAQCTFPWRGWILTSESILVSTIGRAQWQDEKPYAHDCYYLPEVSGELTKDIGWHGAVKPLAVVSDLLKRIVTSGGIVYDPFIGSGTTLIAAESLGRRCYAIEIEPRYVDVAVRRWETFTGRKAELEKAPAMVGVSGVSN